MFHSRRRRNTPVIQSLSLIMVCPETIKGRGCGGHDLAIGFEDPVGSAMPLELPLRVPPAAEAADRNWYAVRTSIAIFFIVYGQ